MFVFREENTFWSTVRVYDPTSTTPAGKGRKVAVEFDCEFKVMPPEFVSEQAEKALLARSKGEHADDQAFLLEEVVNNWKGIKEDGKDGPDFAFSDENLKRLIGLPYVRSAMVETYFEGVNGKARKGN